MAQRGGANGISIITDTTKPKLRSRLTKKPLRDVSNAKTATKSENIPNSDGEQAKDDPLDRLLLVQSDLSSLLHKIDELVVLALQSPSNKGSKEIKQFADVLSEMHTSLKPWVPRFQKALLSKSRGVESNSAEPIKRAVISDPKGSTNDVVDSPEETKLESLVSPSPLVSWRAECNTGGGRQLFLLTPLPQRKAFSSKDHAFPLPTFENIALDDTCHLAPIGDSFGNLNHDPSKGVLVKPPINMDFTMEVNKDVDTQHIGCVSPDTNGSFLMTPCLKMSPIKSCVLLEPLSEIPTKKNFGIHECKRFPVGVKGSSESEDCSQSTDDLKLNYPELYGIKTENLQKNLVEEDSPKWIFSPPKTCLILEPTDDRQEYQDVIGALDLAECSPMVKELASSYRTGKHPGENTLKKELWTRFEAASTHANCFKTCLLETTSKKGFLDQLEEASEF